MVTSPCGWLIRRGLSQRPACSHLKCDDGVRTDTGDGCEVAADVRRLAAQLPEPSGRRALADMVLTEADQRLGPPLEGTPQCVQERAQVVSCCTPDSTG
ncbi:hypothetical protein [Streptomyces sp. D54]|uniref:hypothetical protein n=1 Tax=Streptomyces sp. D54 TaxID=1290289 RepID=UPI003CF46945